MMVGIDKASPRLTWRLRRFLTLEQYGIAQRQLTIYASNEFGRAEVSFSDYAQDGARGHARFLSASLATVADLRAMWEGELAQVKKILFWFEKP